MGSERQNRRAEVVSEVSQKWGQEQIISGPILTIPFRKKVRNNEGRITEYVYNSHFLPENLAISGTIIPEQRRRGIFEAILYTAHLNFEGSFGEADFSALAVQPDEVLWDKAYLTLGVTHMKGIRKRISVEWKGRTISADPGIPEGEIVPTGVTIPLPSQEESTESRFAFSLEINGSDGLLVSPLGRETNVRMDSPWPHPSFIGTFLPESYDISDQGFTASWTVLDMNRNFPQSWTGSRYNIDDAHFGLSLFLPVDPYQKAMRTVKYALMFIGLTFLLFFLIELKNPVRLHPVHYILVGFAILVFYSLLLSLSEHIPFDYAYILGAAGVILLVSLYSRSILQGTSFSVIVAAAMLFLYGYLFVLITLQDFALLTGSLGIFIILAVFMFLTRHTDWIITFKKEEQ